MSLLDPTYQELERKVEELEDALTACDEEVQKVYAENVKLKGQVDRLEEEVQELKMRNFKHVQKRVHPDEDYGDVLPRPPSK